MKRMATGILVFSLMSAWAWAQEASHRDFYRNCIEKEIAACSENVFKKDSSCPCIIFHVRHNQRKLRYLSEHREDLVDCLERADVKPHETVVRYHLLKAVDEAMESAPR